MIHATWTVDIQRKRNEPITKGIQTYFLNPFSINPEHSTGVIYSNPSLSNLANLTLLQYYLLKLIMSVQWTCLSLSNWIFFKLILNLLTNYWSYELVNCNSTCLGAYFKLLWFERKRIHSNLGGRVAWNTSYVEPRRVKHVSDTRIRHDNSILYVFVRICSVPACCVVSSSCRRVRIHAT